MPKVELKPNERFESLMRRFTKSVERDGVMKELHKREAYEKPSVTRKRERAAAKKRAQRASLESQLPTHNG